MKSTPKTEPETWTMTLSHVRDVDGFSAGQGGRTHDGAAHTHTAGRYVRAQVVHSWNSHICQASLVFQKQKPTIKRKP